ncbi:hypothetical protein B0H10DRAFT_2236683 [Mycena sp. CBHHK59/15]|nr:hypothetical protein B0H10DRAFT_2236683 [Mycena sp. CBHHK59/15]
MEMPAPKRKTKTKRNEPDAPRLSTRTQNQHTRPAVDAGLAPGNWRTAAQMEEARATEAVQQADASRKQADAVACVAAIEDEQRKRDQTYAETANHPSRARQPFPNFESDQDDFVPSEHSGDDGDEEEQEVVPRGRVGKPAKSSRNDVTVARSTQDASGTPAGSGQEESSRKRKASENSNNNSKRPGAKKAKTGKKGGLATKPAPKKRAASSALGRSSIVTAPNDDFDAPMTQYGGPAVDDDENERLEHPAPAGKGKKKGVPTDLGLKLVSIPPRRPTKKELRGQS